MIVIGLIFYLIACTLVSSFHCNELSAGKTFFIALFTTPIFAALFTIMIKMEDHSEKPLLTSDVSKEYYRGMQQFKK